MPRDSMLIVIMLIVIMLIVVMLIVVMLIVVMLIVIMLIVVAPSKDISNKTFERKEIYFRRKK